MNTGIRFGLIPLMVLFFCGSVFAGGPTGAVLAKSELGSKIAAMLKEEAHKSSASQRQSDSQASERSPANGQSKSKSDQRQANVNGQGHSARGYQAVNSPQGRNDRKDDRWDHDTGRAKAPGHPQAGYTDDDRSGRGHSAIKGPGGRDDKRGQKNDRGNDRWDHDKDRSPANFKHGFQPRHDQASFKHDRHPGAGHQKVKPKPPHNDPPRGQSHHYAWYGKPPWKPHWKPGFGGPWHGYCRPGFDIWCQKACGDTSPSSPSGSKKWWGNQCTPGKLAKCQDCGFLD